MHLVPREQIPEPNIGIVFLFLIHKFVSKLEDAENHQNNTMRTNRNRQKRKIRTSSERMLPLLDSMNPLVHIISTSMVSKQNSGGDVQCTHTHIYAH